MSSLELCFVIAGDNDEENWELSEVRTLNSYSYAGYRSSISKMDKENSKLYVENYHMMFENERLRLVAERLAEEKAALLSELTRKVAAAVAAQTTQMENMQLDADDSGSPSTSTSTSTSTVTANKKGNKSRTKKRN